MFGTKLSLILGVLIAPGSAGNCLSNKEISDKLYLQYDKEIMPRPSVGDEWISVQVQLSIKRFLQISETDSEILIDLRFDQKWNDSRLYFDTLNSCNEFALIDENRIWTPKIEFTECEILKIMPFSSTTVRKTGLVRLSHRLKLSCPCQMPFSRFPFDKTYCNLSLQSISYNQDELSLSWVTVPLIVKKQQTEKEDWKLKENRTFLESTEWGGANFSLLSLELTFDRASTFYLFNTFVPACVAVVVAWIAIHLGPKAATGKALLMGASLFAVFGIMVHMNHSLPKISNSKSIDYYLLGCVLFILIAMVELAFSNYCHRKGSQGEKLLQKYSMVQDQIDEKIFRGYSELDGKDEKWARLCGCSFGFCFIVAFIAYNICYFLLKLF